MLTSFAQALSFSICVMWCHVFLFSFLHMGYPPPTHTHTSKFLLSLSMSRLFPLPAFLSMCFHSAKESRDACMLFVNQPPVSTLILLTIFISCLSMLTLPLSFQSTLRWAGKGVQRGRPPLGYHNNLAPLKLMRFAAYFTQRDCMCAYIPDTSSENTVWHLKEDKTVALEPFGDGG